MVERPPSQVALAAAKKPTLPWVILIVIGLVIRDPTFAFWQRISDSVQAAPEEWSWVLKYLESVPKLQTPKA